MRTPIYETGYYEEREPELYGIDATTAIEPTISTGDWGWLCSAYAPVYDSRGNIVCQVGCDFGMDEVMAERYRSLLYIILAAVVFTIIVLAGAVLYVTRIIIRPINSLTAEMKNFKPAVNADYDQAGVARLDIHSRDEIEELYQGIRSMQMNIVDYLGDLDVLQKDKERAEEIINSDDLTGVGSKAAYMKKIREINAAIANGLTDFAVVMVDMNNLKEINDQYGHRNGDLYIRGCCHLICEAFKHSPVYRVGGDEFVALLQNVDFENRYRQVEFLKNSYANAANDRNAEPWKRYSASVGIAELSSADKTVEPVFKRADSAMYEDKQQFRDKFGSGR